MKFLVLALLVAAAVASPIPKDNSDAVELIVNGVPEGSPLELGGIVDVHLNEHVNGQLAASSNLLHPYTAVGIAEAAAAAAAENAPEPDYHIIPEAIVLPEPAEPVVFPTPIVMPNPVAPEVVPESVVLPEPVAPEVLPAPIVLPSPVLPEVVPESVVLPEPVAPEVLPSPIVLPSPVAPEVVPEPESVVMPAPIPPMVIPEPESIVIPEPVPQPAAQGPGEIYNDGLVQVQVNAPQDAGMFGTLQNWFSLVVNYISNGIQTTQQIV